MRETVYAFAVRVIHDLVLVKARTRAATRRYIFTIQFQETLVIDKSCPRFKGFSISAIRKERKEKREQWTLQNSKEN
jgi:hypothetical protein